MSFVIRGLDPSPYTHLYGMDDAQLAAHGAYRYRADSMPGYPDRVEMRDAEIGEDLLLVGHPSMGLDTPYKTSHAIFVREGATEIYEERETVPTVMHRRLLSLRAFDAHGMMMDAELAQGDAIAPTIERLFERSDTSRIHAHYALRGCFAGRITRS